MKHIFIPIAFFTAINVYAADAKYFSEFYHFEPADIFYTDSLPKVLELQTDGDLRMNGYDQYRPFSTIPLNIAGWDNDGVLQKFDVEEIRDTDWYKKGTTLIPSNTDTASRMGVTHQNGSPIMWTRSTGGYFGIVKPIQTEYRSPDWLFSIGNHDNAGSDRDNHVVNMGFNLNGGGGPAKPGLSGIGLSFEDHYEPTPGDSLAEYHTFFIDGEGLQHRLQSYTIRKNNFANWEMYFTLAKYYAKDPTNGGQWFIINRGSPTATSLALLGSGTETGAQFYVDAAASNLQIIPSGLTGSNRAVYLSQWDLMFMPSLYSAKQGGNYYTYFNQHAIAQLDNGCTLGKSGFRFSNYEGCAIKVTHPEDYNSKLFEVTNEGLITSGIYVSDLDSPGAPINILNTDNAGVWRSDPVSALSNTHIHDTSTITTDILSGINDIVNDGGQIHLEEEWGLIITSDDVTNTIHFSVDSSEIATKTDITSGFYIPLVSEAVNTDELPVATEAQYIKVYDVVTVSGRVTINPTEDEALLQFDLSLPIPSNVLSKEYISGIAHSGTTWYSTVEIKGNIESNKARFQYIPKNDIDIEAHNFSYTFTYRIN